MAKVNVKDFDRIRLELKAVLNEPGYDTLNQEYCGPGTGIYYDEDEDIIKVADDWKIDANGDVVEV